MCIFMKLAAVLKGQKGLGIVNIEKYVKMFGLGLLTGVDLPGDTEGIIPNPKWKKEILMGSHGG